MVKSNQKDIDTNLDKSLKDIRLSKERDLAEFIKRMESIKMTNYALLFGSISFFLGGIFYAAYDYPYSITGSNAFLVFLSVFVGFFSACLHFLLIFNPKLFAKIWMTQK